MIPQISAALLVVAGSNRFAEGSWARTADLSTNEKEWKVVVTKVFLNVTDRWILALGVLCEDNVDHPCATVRDMQENLCS